MTYSIMVVEDEFLVALDLAQILQGAGFETAVVRDMDSALRHADAHRVDLATMDINLAGGPDGVVTALALRERHDIPSLFISGSLTPEIRERAATAGPIGFIDKPAWDQEVLSAVKEYLRG